MSNPAVPGPEQDPIETDLLWKQYQLHVDLYKFYMEQLLKLQTFYYGITGAILTYYFTHPKSEYTKFSLLLPLFMSLAFTGFYVYGARLNRYSRQDVYNIRDALGFKVAPDVGVLSRILYIFAALTCLVSLVCGYILFTA